MSSHMRRATLGTLLVLMVVGGFLAGCGEKAVEEAPPVVRPVKVLTVVGDAGLRSVFPATVEAGRRTMLSFRVSGRIEELLVREGDEVSQGQVIARLDPQNYENAAREAQAEYDRADADLRRYQQLYERDAVPRADLDLRRSQRDAALARRDDARANLSYTTLRAPFAGAIGNRYVESFQDVAAQQGIVDLNNTSQVELHIDVPEQIAKAMDERHRWKMHAVFASLPDHRFELVTKEVSTRADEETQTFRITLVMPQPDEITLLPGMTGEVVAERESGGGGDGAALAMYIPATAALADENGGFFVWVIGGDPLAVTRRNIEAGSLRGRDQLEVRSGLSHGEQIAISGVTKLREGALVTIWDPMGKGSQ